MNQRKFLELYRISKKDFESTGLDWKKLEEIYDHFNANRKIYEPAAKDIAERLVSINAVHSVRYRIKDPEHLIEKIIRKKLEFPKRDYTVKNYVEKIDDIIGVRALHLYKTSWEEIGNFIEKTWSLKEKPTVNIRKGDPEGIRNIYKQKGYEIKEHEYGYRSIHYIIELNPTKKKFTAELQVRTIFEEGWSEIDHDIRYPYDLKNPILGAHLNIFNGLAGNADEMGTYILGLKKQLADIDENNKRSIRKRDKIIRDLKSKVKKFEGRRSLKNEIYSDIDKLSNPKDSVSIANGLSNAGYFNPNLSGSLFVNPSVSFPDTTNGSISFCLKNRCAECGKPENDLYPVTSSAMVLGDQFHACPSCKRLLCNDCWPHYNFTYTLTSLNVGGLGAVNTDKCPKCVREGK
jgi:ppGpp synthetase/RelA/SpoT-type nucleotidyltranferase